MRRTSFSLVALTLALAAGVALAAQQPPQTTTQAVILKGKAPVSNELLKVKLPRPTEAQLSNGAHLMVLEDHRAPQITFSIAMPGGGGYYDAPDMIGLASATASLMREGTASKTSAQISEQLETMAATVNAGASLTGIDATVAGSSLTENFQATLALAADVLLHPTFAPEELARYKERMKPGLLQQRTSPNFLGSELYQRLVYGAHPASRISPTAESIDRLTRDAVVAWHKAHYVPDHALIAVSGDITLAAAKQAFEAALASWPKSSSAAASVAEPAAMGAGRVSFIARPGSVQTTLMVGTQAIARIDPDYDAFQVMNKVLGGGPTGRLFTHLREEKGYTYGAGSALNASRWKGDWLASMDVRTDVTAPAMTDLMAEIARMRDEEIPQKDFDNARRSLIAQFALGLESPAAVLGNYVTLYWYKLPANYWDTYPDRVNAVTRAQALAVAKKYLDLSRLQIVAVGDPKVADAFKAFGTVEMFDVNGKPIVK